MGKDKWGVLASWWMFLQGLAYDMRAVVRSTGSTTSLCGGILACHVEVFPITPVVGGSHAHIAHAPCKPSHHTLSCHYLRAWPAIGTHAIWANFGSVGRVVGAST